MTKNPKFDQKDKSFQKKQKKQKFAKKSQKNPYFSKKKSTFFLNFLNFFYRLRKGFDYWRLGWIIIRPHKS
jgi:hypothetical protein